VESDKVGGIIAGVVEQNRQRRRCRVLYRFACCLDDSEYNYKMRSLGCSGNACYSGLRVKFRGNGGNNHPRNQQHSDKFEPAIHGN